MGLQEEVFLIEERSVLIGLCLKMWKIIELSSEQLSI